MVTLQDVARAAGVSIATASWAVNDNKDVRIPESTRIKVRKVAEELGYRQNALARSLARGRSDLIGFISDGVATSPFAGQVIQGAQDEAWRNGKILLIVDTNGDPLIEQRAFSFMLERRVEGIAYSSWVHHAVKPPEELKQVNSVLINCFDESRRFPAVVPDEVQGGRTATELLLAAGHRRIAFINEKEPSPASVGRLTGYKKALSTAGIEFDAGLLTESTADQEGGYRAAGRVLASGATAVFCHNDRTAMGLLDALHERGVRVPQDLSLVGFDNQEVISAHLHPALTTVGLPQYDLGLLGIRALLAHGRQAGAVSAVGEVLRVACPAIVRESIRAL
ncbi:Transcriptional regulator, LacI family [Bifidobacterium actinocoloniiforme DSM 22766]|uniref:Transcriptional regulator, LacI family n=1 Tax=Bifidobacterium actinocoloniiforme DSM 22766 TaxID=1437605 RepID=A0A086YYB1_9BIFI|nr:LacI family DNA-binding transcriptional regulator [Bifidobacterium actinocoloniiforme]AKV55826.1 LacI family transcriptional regulator [Bifidobacterium actinocoloniiforme DSM 22766]KFI39261.1 Transcriptional regulator, LacI family [Bifidobacterium actinocoloniiforme DSM 22766]